MRLINITQPMFLTLTGADDKTDMSEMLDISHEFRGMVEWGILMSPKRHGTPRYPTIARAERYVDTLHRTSLHLCGGYARDANAGDTTLGIGCLVQQASRVQVNATVYDYDACAKFATKNLAAVILQTRDMKFPSDRRFSWLFDRSGGRGIAQTEWPLPSNKTTVGYAGGIKPETLAGVIASVRNSSEKGAWFWIDAESSLRTEDDRFSLKKCRQMLKIVVEMAGELA